MSKTDKLTPAEYQEIQRSTTLPQCNTAEYMAIGIANEAGEALGLIKKLIRQDDHIVDNIGKFSEDLEKELGDVMWYIVGLCNIFEIDFQDVIDINAAKVLSRHERGTVQGNGDNR